MDIQQMARKREVRERDSGDGDVGCSRFRSVMDDMVRYGWLVPGHEKLTRTLTVAAILGDDVAVAQLHDLFEQERIAKWDGEVHRLVDGFRHVYAGWTPATKATFLRHCREKGVYRRRAM